MGAAVHTLLHRRVLEDQGVVLYSLLRARFRHFGILHGHYCRSRSLLHDYFYRIRLLHNHFLQIHLLFHSIRSRLCLRLVRQDRLHLRQGFLGAEHRLCRIEFAGGVVVVDFLFSC